jgi:ABC-2 type transport system permease protein
VLIRLSWLGVLAAGIVLILNEPAELAIEPANVFGTSAALVGLAFLSGATALLLGALTGRRVLAVATGAGVAVLGYVLNAIANQTEDAAWLRSVSPFSWAYQDRPLADGTDWAALGLLWGLGIAIVALATMSLRQRDITG